MADEQFNPQLTMQEQGALPHDNYIPEQVRRAAARAEELAAAVAAEQGQAPEPGGDAAPPPQPEPQPEPQEGWEQRYRTLQGKYDSEIPTLRQQVANMERLVASMQSAPPPPPPQQRQQPQAVISQEDVDTYGPELIEAQNRWVAAHPIVQELRDEIAQLRGGQQTLSVNTARERVHQGLDSDPDLAKVWRVMNGDTHFLNWLRQPDPLSGNERFAMLQRAYDSGDAMRAARFFKNYIAEHTPPEGSYLTQPSGQTGSPPPGNGNGYVPPANGGGARLEDFVAPGRAASSGGGGAPDKRIWTKQEIASFFDDRRRGRWRGREAESLQVEADIFAATTEGRIRS